MLRAADTIAKTDTGRQRRRNEDRVFARPPVFVVADGMGGAQAGEVAARIAVEAFKAGLSGSGTAEERLASRAHEANRQIFDVASTQHDRAGMGTTLTAAYLDGSELVIAHVGDSRAYLFRGGSLTRLTQDHSLVDELVRRGKLSEEEAAEHPQRSIITRALGPEPTVEVDTWTYPVRGGDVLLLCSDGLTSMVAEERVAEILGQSHELEEVAQGLIDEANRAGGRDNITVVLVRLEEVEAEIDGAGEHATLAVPAVGQRGTDDPASADAPGGGGEDPAVSPAVAVTAPGEAPPPESSAPAPAAESTSTTRHRAPRFQWPTFRSRERQRRRFSKPVAVLLAVVIVLCLVGAGGYLASRQLYFIGTNGQGIVTIYRGFPYDLPIGIHLYETFYVSGVPASLVPSDRRAALFNNSLRSESSATNTVRELELGRISK
jgi:serine/threonine protein phosphatase PrpC